MNFPSFEYFTMRTFEHGRRRTKISPFGAVTTPAGSGNITVVSGDPPLSVINTAIGAELADDVPRYPALAAVATAFGGPIGAHIAFASTCIP
jgi:hypothetical protein